MKAGILTEKIIFKAPVITRGDYGDEDISYEDKIKTRAYVNKNNGNRIIINDEVYWTDVRTFIVRIYHEVDESYILEYQGHNYRILDIDKDARWQRMLISAEKIKE